MLALSLLPDVEITAFEKAPAAQEAGAWISLTVTELKVLNKLVPPSEVEEIAYLPSDRAVYVTRHWRTGEELVRRYSSDSIREDIVQARTHREPLLGLLVKHHADGVVQYGKKVVDIEEGPDGAKLRFDDGRTLGGFDLVVAADGIYSTLRKKFLAGPPCSLQGQRQPQSAY